jgi:hypothetical protein
MSWIRDINVLWHACAGLVGNYIRLSKEFKNQSVAHALSPGLIAELNKFSNELETKLPSLRGTAGVTGVMIRLEDIKLHIRNIFQAMLQLGGLYLNQRPSMWGAQGVAQVVAVAGVPAVEVMASGALFSSALAYWERYPELAEADSPYDDDPLVTSMFSPGLNLRVNDSATPSYGDLLVAGGAGAQSRVIPFEAAHYSQVVFQSSAVGQITMGANTNGALNGVAVAAGANAATVVGRNVVECYGPAENGLTITSGGANGNTVTGIFATVIFSRDAVDPAFGDAFQFPRQAMVTLSTQLDLVLEGLQPRTLGLVGAYTNYNDTGYGAGRFPALWRAVALNGVTIGGNDTFNSVILRTSYRKILVIVASLCAFC